MSNDAQFFRVAPGTVGSADIHPVVRASSVYGGFTVIAAYVVAGAAGTANVILQNYGTSGTVAGGTVAAFTAGTTVFVTDSPQELTITAANQFIDDGEWLVLKMDGALPANSVVVIETVPGVTTTG